MIDSLPRLVFSARGFLAEMRRGVSVGDAHFFTASGSQLAPATLDEYPDPAVAWVSGIYALVAGRRPDVALLRRYTRALRGGTPPAQVLDSISGGPGGGGGGAVPHPDLLEAYVTGAYLVCLGRLPDAGGLTTHVAALQRGMTESQLLERLLNSEEADAEFRFPPAPVDELEILARTIQTVALRAAADPEHTAWAHDALTRGVPARLVVRSMARRVRGRSPRGVFAALTARPRAASAARAARLTLVREEVLRDRVWQWKLQRATWRRLDRIEGLAASGRPLPADDPHGRILPS
jgi:hypothetical protein